jgi:hypothetical protein
MEQWGKCKPGDLSSNPMGSREGEFSKDSMPGSLGYAVANRPYLKQTWDWPLTFTCMLWHAHTILTFMNTHYHTHIHEHALSHSHTHISHTHIQTQRDRRREGSSCASPPSYLGDWEFDLYNIQTPHPKIIGIINIKRTVAVCGTHLLPWPPVLWWHLRGRLLAEHLVVLCCGVHYCHPGSGHFSQVQLNPERRI